MVSFCSCGDGAELRHHTNDTVQHAAVPQKLPVVRLTGGWLLAEHPYTRNHGSGTSANMFEVEKSPAVSYL